VDGAELPVDGAAEPAEEVWGGAADWLASCDDSDVVVGTGVVGAIAAALGVTRTGVAITGDAGFRGLTGLTGDSTLVALVIDLTHEFDEVVHSPHKSCP
jgi:hypothetical protein